MLQQATTFEDFIPYYTLILSAKGVKLLQLAIAHLF